MNVFMIYNLMYLVLEELNEEKPIENLSNYLSDANPYIWEGEMSGDPLVYNQFKEAYLKGEINTEDYGYVFICEYLRNLDPYYGDIYSVFVSLTKEEYVDTCKHIISDQPNILKKIS